jgi:flagellar motility protein MotE (MotC chaperone)
MHYSKSLSSKGMFMNPKWIVAVLAVAAVPLCAHAQNQKSTPPNQKSSPAKVTKASAQKVIKGISSDKGKTQVFCDLGKLAGQIDEAEQKKDMKKIDELNQKMGELATKLGPEYASLMDGMQDMDPNSKDAQEIGSMLDTLENSCPK